MTILTVDYRAVRAFARLATLKMESVELGRIADAGFDAGEFSGGWHENRADEVIENTEEVVAAAFGFPVEDLRRMLEAADYEERARFFRAQEN